jgi:hypothetical protein
MRERGALWRTRCHGRGRGCPGRGRGSLRRAASVLRGLARFAEVRGVPAGRACLLDYDVIEAFCVAGLAGRVPSTQGTYRSVLYQLASPVHGEPGCRATPFPGAKAPAPYSPGERAGLAAAAGPRLPMGRCRATFICDHLAAGTPVPVLLAITGIAETGSLARYARHVPGISSSKGSLRARWRAETSR